MNAIASLKSLREAGLSETQAEAIVTVVEEREGDLVTKEYLDQHDSSRNFRIGKSRDSKTHYSWNNYYRVGAGWGLFHAQLR